MLPLRLIEPCLVATAWLVAGLGCGSPNRTSNRATEVDTPVAEVAAPPSSSVSAIRSAPDADASTPLDPRARCLAPLPEHAEPSPCPAAAEAAACRFAEGTEYFLRRDYPAAAERFIALSLEESGQLGRAAAENAVASILSLAGEGRRPSCRVLYQTLAPQIVDRHCPLPQSASDRDCHTMHRMQFSAQKGLAVLDFERSKQKDSAGTATALNGLFERYCMAAGPLNNAHQDPVAAGCDEALSNAHRLFLQLGDVAQAERLRVVFLDPANRLAASPYAQDFATRR